MIRNRRSKVDISSQAPGGDLSPGTERAEWQLYREVTEYIRRRFRDVDSTSICG
jgi:hypothetical protein